MSQLVNLWTVTDSSETLQSSHLYLLDPEAEDNDILKRLTAYQSKRRDIREDLNT